MVEQELSSLTFVAIQAALKAGDLLKKGFGTSFKIMTKPGKHNFVTEYDQAAEEAIISLIQENFPKHSFLAEESGLNETNQEQILWIIDPLDGTTNFAHHIPIFTISIAAYFDNHPLCGVIYQPISQELYIAERGKGAFLNGNRLTVSSTQVLNESIVGAGFPYYGENHYPVGFDQLTHFLKEGVSFRNLGSAALTLAYVAAGKLDGFWMHHLYPWDLAAGKLLIEEAGGQVTSFDGTQHLIKRPASILATNGLLHSKMIKHLL